MTTDFNTAADAEVVALSEDALGQQVALASDTKQLFSMEQRGTHPIADAVELVVKM